MRVLFKKRSFTILELVIVLVIVGILAAVSVPAFTTIKEKALVNEAIANLKLIAAAEKIYGTEIQGYFDGGNAAQINSALKLSLTDKNWDYRVIADAVSFEASAFRPWPGGDCEYNMSNTMSEPAPVNDPNIKCP